MKLNINKIRALVFLVAALGYLPLQSADHSSQKKEMISDVKVELSKEDSSKSVVKNLKTGPLP